MQSNESLIRLRNLLISLAIFVALVFYASTYSEPVLRVAVMPDESPPVLRRKFKPLTDYLEKKIGMKMEFRPVLDGDALVNGLINRKLDLVWINGVYFARANARSNGQIISLVRREVTDQRQPESVAYQDYTWAVRAGMDAGLRQKIRDALLALSRNKGQDREILDLQGTGRFVPAGAE